MATSYQRKKDNFESSSTSETQDKHQNKSHIAENAVKEIFKKKHGFSNKDLEDLRRQYKDSELYDQIQEMLFEKKQILESRGRKAAKLIIDKYPNFPLGMLLKKALKLKEKLHMSDEEFSIFRKTYEDTILQRSSKSAEELELMFPKTSLGKLLGTYDLNITEGLHLAHADYAIVQDILQLHGLSKNLHVQVILQSLSYKNITNQSISVKFDPSKNSVYSAISPILVAMFLQKIDMFDNAILYGNIGNIVAARYNKKPLETSSDLHLFNNLVRNSYDVVCDRESPIKDLKNRFLLQTAVWENVLKLRMGRIFDDIVVSKFSQAVDNCRVTNYDAPDFLYAGDEAFVFRRMMNAFSIRPIIVRLRTNFPIVPFGSMGQQFNAGIAYSGEQSEIPVISQLPMMQCSIDQLNNKMTGKNISLIDGVVNAPEFMLENNVIIPRTREIEYVMGVFAIHVNRRHSKINYAKMLQPFAFNNLPIAFPNVDNVSTDAIEFPWRAPLTKNGAQFRLSSVILVTVDDNIKQLNPTANALVIGSSAIVIRHPDNVNTFNTKYYLYDPLRASRAYVNQNPAAGQAQATSYMGPYSEMQENEARKLISVQGTVFIYTAEKDIALTDQQLRYSVW